VILSVAAAVLLLASSASELAPVFGKNGPAVRIATVETELCLAGCPPFPAEVTNDWLRSEEGRRVNGCPMGCRLQQPSAAFFRDMCALALSEANDLEAPRIRALGRDAPELMRRLRAAIKDAEGRRLGPLCARARASLPSDEKAYLECSGRAVRQDAVEGGGAGPDPARALRCSVLFAEREADWATRCPVLEAKADVRDCVERAGAPARPHRKAATRPKDDCEASAVETLAGAFRGRRR
jgi:hypothetical protein